MSKFIWNTSTDVFQLISVILPIGRILADNVWVVHQAEVLGRYCVNNVLLIHRIASHQCKVIDLLQKKTLD